MKLTLLCIYLQDAIDESSSMDSDDIVVEEIPGSNVLWEATPRPSNSSDVRWTRINLNRSDRLVRSGRFLSKVIEIC